MRLLELLERTRCYRPMNAPDLSDEKILMPLKSELKSALHGFSIEDVRVAFALINKDHFLDPCFPNPLTIRLYVLALKLDLSPSKLYFDWHRIHINNHVSDTVSEFVIGDFGIEYFETFKTMPLRFPEVCCLYLNYLEDLYERTNKFDWLRFDDSGHPYCAEVGPKEIVSKVTRENTEQKTTELKSFIDELKG